MLWTQVVFTQTCPRHFKVLTSLYINFKYLKFSHFIVCRFLLVASQPHTDNNLHILNVFIGIVFVWKHNNAFHLQGAAEFCEYFEPDQAIAVCAVAFLLIIFSLSVIYGGVRGSRLLQPAQVCDVLKGFIMVLCYSMMSYVDYSMMYHLIRGQSVIKLYIIYNMLEVRSVFLFYNQLSAADSVIISSSCRSVSLWRQVADRLFSAFGQDILDALYWTATEPKEKKSAHIGVIPHFLMAVLYVCILIKRQSVISREGGSWADWKVKKLKKKSQMHSV